MKSLTTMLLILPLATACASSPSKSELDAEVKRLCAIDGGVKVFETVVLPANRFDKYGGIRVPSKDDAKSSDDYYVEWHVRHIVDGNPSLRRDQFQLIRRTDYTLIGEAISYGRRGGDLPGPSHDSSLRCPENASDQDLFQRVFVKSN